LEQPAHPTRRHRSAVAIPQPDSHRAQLVSLAARLCSYCVEAKPDLSGELVQLGKRRRLCRDENRAGTVALLSIYWMLEPVDFFATRKQPVHGDDRIVDSMIEQVTCGVGDGVNFSRRRLHQPVDLLERSIESLEHSIKHNSHLISD